jgi:outer membrane protein insertion porin family
MSSRTSPPRRLPARVLAGAVLVAACLGLSATAEPPVAGGPAAGPPVSATDRIIEVRIEGNHATPVSRLPKLVTRAGQIFDATAIEEDVRALHRSRKFVDVHPKYVRTAEGIVVIFQVVERPLVRYVKYVGNQRISTRSLRKKAEIDIGDSMDPYAVEEARRRIEAHYHEKGYDTARVTTIEGGKAEDKGAVFLIDEGRRRKALWTNFVGNTIASDARLLTQIKSKPGIFWMFGGDIDREVLDRDVEQITAYYRSLGFFQAKVSRELQVVHEGGRDWTHLTFVIDEGPRYSVRNVSFVGNSRFKSEFLERDLKLKSGEAFNQSKMDTDLNLIRDIYGGRGYVFADVRADPRFLEEPGQLDLVYSVEEGQRYRVGAINVKISGDHPHTRHATVLNRLSLRPGDILDVRKLREDERRLRSSMLFVADPAKGEVPRIVFSKAPPEAVRTARDPDRPGFRGQSPDDDEPLPLDLIIQSEPDGDHPGPENLGPDEPRPADPRHAGQRDGCSQELPTIPATVPGRPATGQPAGQPVTPPGRTLREGTVWRGQSPQPFPQQPAYPQQQPAFQPQPSMQQQPAPALEPWGGAPLAPTGPEAVDYSRFAAPPPPPGQQPVYTAQQPVPGMQPSDPFTGFPPPPGVQPLPGMVPGGMPAFPQQPFGPPQFAPPLEVFPGGDPYVLLDVDVAETQTGRLMVGAGVNSNAGLVGNIVVDEQNFDLFRLPRSWDDVRNGVAFRGAGQRFRLEAAPGTELQRYMATFQEPYLFDTRVGLSLSASYFTRFFFDWSEARTGGRVGAGYQFAFAPDLSVNAGFRGENVNIYNPRVPAPAILDMVGSNAVYGFSGGIIHDTRDSPFLPTQGHLLTFEFEQVIGTYVYPRGVLEGRQYFLLRERPDGSGRHVVGVGSILGMSGPNTPAYDNFFAGGFNTIRGFAFRGASPVQVAPNGAVAVIGGPFQWLNTVEYMYPITADDSLRGVFFTDFGTVESIAKIDNFRVAPGFGFRITLPALGPAPIALDFAFPVAYAPFDNRQVFSFFVGFAR